MESKCKDHLGNEFANTEELCNYYGIDYNEFVKKVGSGYTVEIAIQRLRPVVDVFGRVHKSKQALCKFYGLDYSYYLRRENAGYSEEQILLGKNKVKLVDSTKEPKTHRTITDHLGVSYESAHEMCNYWGVPYVVYLNRRCGNYNSKLEYALTAPIADKHKSLYMDINTLMTNVCCCKDHLSNEYRDVKSMCDYWNISTAEFRLKLRQGYSVNAIFAEDSNEKARVTCIDHRGNTFYGVREMCYYWGVSPILYQERFKEYEDVEKALFNNKDIFTEEVFVDHKGKEYTSVGMMCANWKINPKLYLSRRLWGWGMAEALETPVLGENISE